MRTYQCWTLKDGFAYIVTYNNVKGIGGAEFRRRCQFADKFFATFKLIPRLKMRKPLEDIVLETVVDQATNFTCCYPAMWKQPEGLQIKVPLLVAIEYTGPLIDNSEKEEVNIHVQIFAERLQPVSARLVLSHCVLTLTHRLRLVGASIVRLSAGVPVQEAEHHSYTPRGASFPGQPSGLASAIRM